MFRATMFPSSVETAVLMRHLVFTILYGWLSGMQGGVKMYRKEINVQRKILHQVGFIYKNILFNLISFV